MSWQTPENLSADEIAVLLGFTDAADFTAALAAKIAAATLTTNGDLLTRTAGVPARLGLGSALQVLRTNAGATALEFADPSGGAVCQVARFSRVTSDQGSLSGSYARNIVAYNEETQDDAGEWSNSSGTLTYSGTTGKVHDIGLNTTYMGSEGIFILARSTDGGSTWSGLCMRWYTGAGSGMVNTVSVPGIALTNGDKLRVEFYSSAAASVLSYRQQSLATYIPAGSANCITIVRRT